MFGGGGVKASATIQGETAVVAMTEAFSDTKGAEGFLGISLVRENQEGWKLWLIFVKGGCRDTQWL